MHPIVLSAACVLGLFLATVSSAAEILKAGAATSNLTPWIGDDIIGGFNPVKSKHIHDELHARCLVLDDGDTRVALVVCDLLGIDRLVSEEARRLIAENVKIPRENVLISATHTHSAASALGKERFKHDQKLDEYQRFVARRIADGVARAANELRPAEFAFATAEAPEHVNNRRWTMRPGTVPENPFGGVDLVKMNPPAGSPNLVAPAGPVDPTISILSFREPGGAPIAVYAAYSLHYVGGEGPGHISADYYGVFCRHLERLLKAEHQSPPLVAMLANGTSGDVNNINFREPRGKKEPYEQIHFVAEDVASKVHAALGELEYKPHASLGARYREPTLIWRRPDEKQRAWAEQTIAKATPGKRDLPLIYAERTMALADYPETTTVPLQVLRIGDVCLGTMPCEVFCEIGLDFKRRSPLQPAFMVSLAHGYFGYLPTPRHHDLGGYETWIGTNRLERDASDKLLDELLGMSAELKE